MKLIPNLFTLLNLIFGCIAIVFILQTGESIVLLQQEGFTDVNLPEKITWGCFFIFAAGLVDFLDGLVARLFKASSAMGKQLDSLADVVSFGVAPGLILYQLLRVSYAQEENGLDISMAWLLPAFLIPAAAAWRLAKFNLDDEQKSSFKGVPAPAVGLVIASFPLIMHFQTFNLQFVFINRWLLYAIILLLSFFMISGLPMMSLVKMLSTFATAVHVEQVHPIETGMLRLRHPSERRPGLPRENSWLFWPRFVLESAGKTAALLGVIASLMWRWWRIARDPAARAYMDEALMPVTDENDETLDLLTKTSGIQAALSHQKKVAALTHGAPVSLVPDVAPQSAVAPQRLSP